MELRQELRQAVAAERAKQELAGAACTDDSDLIERLFVAGFTAETLPALSAAPIALVAWGSGQVTREELAVAMQAIRDSEVAEQYAAIAKFQSWLETRPGPELFALWQDFTQVRFTKMQVSEQESNQMIHWLNQVALSSGGVLGFGAICAEERAIIQRIREVLLGNTISSTPEGKNRSPEAA
jgi:hypothetical protein